MREQVCFLDLGVEVPFRVLLPLIGFEELILTQKLVLSVRLVLMVPGIVVDVFVHIEYLAFL